MELMEFQECQDLLVKKVKLDQRLDCLQLDQVDQVLLNGVEVLIT